MSETRADIAVVGAGVIGLTAALLLAQAGREVVMVDPAEPGSGASHGNAGTIADYAVQPVGTPDVLRGLWPLLTSRTSPLSIMPGALPMLAPWLLRFARASLPGASRRNAVALAGLLQGAGARWDALAAEIGAGDLIMGRGCLYLFETRAALDAAQGDLTFRRSLGVAVEMVDAGALAAMEPGLPRVAGAAFFPGARFLTDPGMVMARLWDAARGAGVRHLRHAATGLSRDRGRIVLTGPGLALQADRAVIAAGAHSRVLAAQAGSRVPLVTERGYHAEWDMDTPPLTRPACPTTRGFYLCPMAGRLRVAGTVELGGTAAPPSPHRIAQLVKGARAIFPDLGAPDRTWLGYRPSIPDSLPVIGPSGGGADVVLAFGHGHLGVTLAPVTAEIVAGALAGRAVPAPVSPARFG